jgi:hypothetical protein
MEGLPSLYIPESLGGPRRVKGIPDVARVGKEGDKKIHTIWKLG